MSASRWLTEAISWATAPRNALVGSAAAAEGTGVAWRAESCRPKGAALTDVELLDWCKGKLAAFKLPKVAVIATEIPRNPRGKILKRVLREQVKDAVRAPE